MLKLLVCHFRLQRENAIGTPGKSGQRPTKHVENQADFGKENVAVVQKKGIQQDVGKDIQKINKSL